MNQHHKDVFVRALLFGLVYAWADTAFVFKMSQLVMEMNWSPFTVVTAYLALFCFLWGFLACLVVGLLGGKRLEGRADLHVHLSAGTSIVMVFLASPQLDQVLAMGLGGVGITHGTMLLINRLLTWKPVTLLPLAMALAGIWYGMGIQGRAPELHDETLASRPVPPSGTPNVLWIVFDTTRSDHLSTYGYERETDPNLKALAKESTVFERAYATAPWTMASHASMFTGLYSAQHWCNHEHLYLNADRTTSAEILHAAGFETAVFAGNPWFGDHSGLTQGFSDPAPAWREGTLYNLFATGRLRMMLSLEGLDKGGQQVVSGFKNWVTSERDQKRPFFAYLNFLEAHAPYDQVPYEDAKQFLEEGVSYSDAKDISELYMRKMMFATDFQATPDQQRIIKQLYDGGIYNVDRRLGEVLAFMRERGMLDNTLVIVNADHGELFGEHDIYGHDVSLYHPLVHVPLVVRYPKVFPAGVRIDNPVQLTDLYSTVLEVTGLSDKAGPDVVGRSLLEHLNGGGDPQRPVYAEEFRTLMRPLIKEIERMGFDPKTFKIHSVQVRDVRMIRWPKNTEKVFDISTDPGELTDIKEQRPEVYQQLKDLMDAFEKTYPPARDAVLASPGMDEATKEKLKALGYVQ
ncbi:MAG: sulfatase-like hydrolase/transferase [Myxococcota bacterium]